MMDSLFVTVGPFIRC